MSNAPSTAIVANAMNRRRLTEHEAAAYLGLKGPTLRNWRWGGRGPKYLRMGRAIRYDLADLDAFLESCRAGGEAE